MLKNFENRSLNSDLNTSNISENSFSSYDLQENLVYRCLQCPFIPIMKLQTDSKKTYIYSKCRLFHSYKQELSKYLNENDKNQLYKIPCCKCNESINKKKIPFYYWNKWTL